MDHKLADLEPVQQIRECVVMILVGVASFLNFLLTLPDCRY